MSCGSAQELLGLSSALLEVAQGSWALFLGLPLL